MPSYSIMYVRHLSTQLAALLVIAVEATDGKERWDRKPRSEPKKPCNPIHAKTKAE